MTISDNIPALCNLLGMGLGRGGGRHKKNKHNQHIRSGNVKYGQTK